MDKNHQPCTPGIQAGTYEDADPASVRQEIKELNNTASHGKGSGLVEPDTPE